jgi:hypothetical protein
MKKQLLIAAVAATMGTAAIADIAITGNMKVNYTNTDTNGTVSNKVNHEANLVIAGSNGDTSVHIEMALDDSANDTAQATTVGLEDVYLTTSVGDIKLKTGAWNGSDTILDKDSARTNGNYILSTAVSGVAISLEGDSEEASTSVKVAGSVSGVALSYKAKATQDEVTVAGSVAGVDIAYANIDADAAASDKSSVSLNYSTNGFDLSYVNADADANAVISGDSYFGDVTTFETAMAAGDDISGFGVKTTLAGNTVQLKSFTMEDYSASADVDFIKVIATRALANGTTFEATYTDEDSTTAASDRETFDLELAVKF